MMKSIAEIDILEQAHVVGAPTLGVAADELVKRWKAGLRDNETFIRLAFLSWYSLSEPNWYNGLPESSELPSVDDLMEDLGGIQNILPESKFVLAGLATGYAWAFRDESRWTLLAKKFPLEAIEKEPSSLVFKEWRFLFGIDESNNELKRNIASEFHARFNGRGTMGDYFLSVFGNGIGL